MNYTHYGNAGIPFALVKEYNSYAAMVADFKSGELCTDVRYGEYVIISNDDPENIDFIHNGSIYRRGYNYWNEETGGAIFISNISESQNKVTQEAIEATKEAQSATKEMNDLYSEVKTNETDRVEKEAARVKAENVRNFAEQQRQSNEENRQQTIATWDEAIDDLPSYHKRMYNLEDNTLEKEVIASDSMINEVPAEKMTYCSIEEIGGMSHKCENLIPYPYRDTTKTENGITFIDNGDGTITVNGTATANASFMLAAFDTITYVNGVTYYLSGCPKGGSLSSYTLCYNVLGFYDVGNGISLNFGEDQTNRTLVIRIYEGVTVNNLTFKPMLNYGETALPYEPYFEGLRDTKVTEVQSVGRNLIDINKGINECLKKHQDGTYIFTKIDKNKRFAATIPLFIPANKTIKMKIDYLEYSSEIGKNGLQIVLTRRDGTSATTRIWTSYSYQTFSDKKDIVAITLYLDAYYSDGVYIKFKNIYFTFNEEIDNYSPYFKETLPIPEGVQALEGYGQGINEEYHNKIILDPKNNIKKFVKNVGEYVFTDEISLAFRGQNTSGLYIYSCNINMPKYLTIHNTPIITTMNYKGTVAGIQEVLDSGYTAAAFLLYYNPSMLNSRALYILSTKDNVADVLADIVGKSFIYVLQNPEETDLSSYFTDDNMLKTEEGGTLTFVNEYDYDVPNKVVYYETTLLNNEDILNERGNRLDKTISQDLFTNTIVNQEVDIEINNKNIKNNIEALNDNLIYSEIDEGDEYIKDVPDDVLPYAEITEIGGMTYKSENLIRQTDEIQNSHGITFIKNFDGSITVNGTAVEQAYNTMAVDDLPNGTYTLSLKGTNDLSHIYISFTDGTGASIGIGKSYSFIITDTKKYQYCILNVNKGYTISNETYYVMFNKGETALSYQPYFEGLRDSKVTEVESVGVNLFSGIDGVDFSKEISINKLTSKEINCNFKPNTRYRFSWTSTCISADGTDHMLYLIVNYTDGTVDNWSNVIARVTDNKARKIITTAEGKTVSTMEFIYATEGTFLFEEISLTEYTGVDIPYTPYFRSTFSIPEEVQSLDGYGQGVNDDYYNKIVLDPASGMKKFVQCTRRIVFDGTEAWNYSTTTERFSLVAFDGIWRAKPYNHQFTIPCKSNAFDFTFKVHHDSDRTNGIVIIDRSILIRDARFASADEFKAYLAEQYAAGTPVMAEYVLATSIETDLTPYFTDDNLIGIEANGTITAVNEYNYDVPFTVNYKKKKENVSIENITHELGEEEKKVPSQKLFTNTARDLDDKITQNSIDIEINNKRLQNLEAALIGDTIEPVIDDTIAYVKDVPSNALPYASINEIGGISYKCENLWDEIWEIGFIEIETGNNAPSTTRIRSKNFIPCKGETVYSIAVADVNTIMYCYDINKKFLGIKYFDKQKITTVADARYMRFMMSNAYGTEYKNDIAVYEGEVKSYQPYFTGLRDSKVTAVESVGANLFDPQKIIDAGGTETNGEYIVDPVQFYQFWQGKDISSVPYKKDTRYIIGFEGRNDNTADKAATIIFTIAYTDGSQATMVFVKTNEWKYECAISKAGKDVLRIGVTYSYSGTSYLRKMFIAEYTGDNVYTPFVKRTFSIPEAVQNLDGYGQGVNKNYHNKIVLDPASGEKKFVKRFGVFDLGMFNWMQSTSPAKEFRTRGNEGVKLTLSTETANILCSYPGYTIGSANEVYNAVKNVAINQTEIWIYDPQYHDADEFKAAMSGVMLLYELATPTETDVSAYFTDDNLIGVEGGGTVTAVNEYEHDVPTTFEYLTKGATT